MYSALNHMASVGIALAYPIWEGRGGLVLYPTIYGACKVHSRMDDPMEGGIGKGYANDPSGLF